MNVKLVDLEETSVFGTRALNIQHNGKVIKTPYRALTQNELSGPAAIPKPVALRSDLGVIQMNLPKVDVDKLLTQNKFIQRKIGILEDYRMRYQHSKLTFAFLQPSDSWLILGQSKDKFLRRSIAIQNLAGFEIITIPWLKQSAAEWISNADAYIKVPGNKEPMFVVDLNSDSEELSKICDKLLELRATESIHFVGLNFRQPHLALSSYDTVWEKLKESDLGILLLNTPRSQSSYQRLSGPHLQEFLLGDIFSMYTHSGPIIPQQEGSQNAGKKTRNMDEKIKVFNKKDLSVNNIGNLGDFQWVSDIAECFKNKSDVLAILNNYQQANGDSEREKSLNALTRVHEYIASKEEFKVSRKYIEGNEAKEYISEKSLLSEGLKKISDMKPKK